MAITNIMRDWGVDPSIVRITTTDTLEAITTVGYLTTQAANIEALQNGDFQWQATDIVAIAYDGGKGFFTVDFEVNMNFTVLTITQNVSVTLTTAQIKALYGTPAQIIPAFGANTWIVLSSPIAVEFDFVSAQYQNGGALGLQYGNTNHAGGTAASNTIAAATINGFTDNEGFTLTPAATGTMLSMVNKGIYVAVATGEFTDGDSTMTFNVNYSVFRTTA